MKGAGYESSDMKHVDLFSGIGGFALAAQANGIETVCFCEKDDKCRAFLSKAWPGITIHDDIKTFDGRQYAGAYLLTAGVPCQPASRAGKQRGAADDRWLWPAAIRALEEVRPAWAIFENPPGIGDVGLARILSDVENKGYAVRVFSIPACAVGSPQRRERFWIVCRNLADTANGQDDGGEYGNMADAQGCRQGGNAAAGCASDGLADTEGGRGRPGLGESRALPEPRIELADRGIWQNNVWMPCADGKVRRAPDDSIQLVDGLHRSILGALGNSIVPQVAAQVINAIVQSIAGNMDVIEETPF